MSSAAPRIIRIDGFEVACRLREPIGNSRLTFDTRSSLLVRVTADSGASGWGETWAHVEMAAAQIRDVLGPPLLGADATAPRRAWHKAAAKLGYDRGGVSTMALGALDLALWDCAGHVAEKPVHALLGGKLRDAVPAYVSGPFMKPGSDPYRDFEADVASYLERGFRAVKIRMGTEPAADGAMALRIRRLIGDAMPLMVDLNEGFTLEGGLVIARRIAEADLIWLEEPIAYDNLPGYRRFASLSPTPLAGGEALFGLNAFRDYLTAGVFDFVQPDLALCGGISEAMRICALCDAFDVPVVPHVWGTAVNFMASLHFAACLPARRGRVPTPMFEYDPSDNELRSAFVDPPLDRDGAIRIPDAPGFGLDLTPERLAPYLVRHWTVEPS